MEEIFGNEGIKQRRPVESKYQNPDAPEQQWSGRGRKPAWVVAYLEKGKNLEDLRVEK